MANELKKRFKKKIYGGLAAALSGLLCCACSISASNLSTSVSEDSELIHNLSTLSTEESTSVDNKNVNNEGNYSDGETEQETDNVMGDGRDSDVESENKTEIEAEEEAESESEIESQIETEVEGENELETKTESDTESETYNETDINTEEDSSYIDEILTDAEFYYVYYASVYQSIDEDTSLEFDEKSFVVAYKSIKNETLSDYFSDISWLSREDGISLSFTPNEIMFPSKNESANLWMARCIHAFELVEKAYSSDENWDNPDSLKPQFHCHAIYARQNKVPWNIEPYRTETSFLKIVLASGNPDS